MTSGEWLRYHSSINSLIFFFGINGLKKRELEDGGGLATASDKRKPRGSDGSPAERVNQDFTVLQFIRTAITVARLELR